jgi:hypothetical protein
MTAKELRIAAMAGKAARPSLHGHYGLVIFPVQLDPPRYSSANSLPILQPCDLSTSAIFVRFRASA